MATTTGTRRHRNFTVIGYPVLRKLGVHDVNDTCRYGSALSLWQAGKIMRRNGGAAVQVSAL